MIVNICPDLCLQMRRDVFSELYDLYCRDMAEPEGEVAVISSKDEYNGEGIAFSKEEGILNLPMQEMTDEEILQLVVFNLLGRYVDYEAYVKASNPLYYLNALEQNDHAGG